MRRRRTCLMTTVMVTMGLLVLGHPSGSGPSRRLKPDIGGGAADGPDSSPHLHANGSRWRSLCLPVMAWTCGPGDLRIYDVDRRPGRHSARQLLWDPVALRDRYERLGRMGAPRLLKTVVEPHVGQHLSRLPQSTPGSRRKDNRDLLKEFEEKG